jgi:hypothetical protein
LVNHVCKPPSAEQRTPAVAHPSTIACRTD